MNMETHLTIKHLAGYLPYELKFIEISTGQIKKMVGMDNYIIYFKGEMGNYFSEVKPILRPLSEFGDSDDLRKVHKFIGLGNWCEVYDQYFKAWFDDPCSIDKLILQAPKEIFDYFLSKHFDVFNLIEKGLAIDINKI